MQKKEELLQNFKTAIVSTTKSVSNIQDVEVVFGNQKIKSEKKVISLPEPDNISDKINYLQTRAIADSEALKIRYSNKKILDSFEPKGNMSKKLYFLAEKIRYEKLGSLEFKGIKKNINNSYNEKLKSFDFEKKENIYVDAFENYLRSYIFDTKTEKNFKSYKKKFDGKFKKNLKSLIELISNQSQFNSKIADIISEMDIEEDSNQDIENEERKDDISNKKQSEENDKITKEQSDENNELAVESSSEVTESLAAENNQDTEVLEVENFFDNQSQRKRSVTNFGDKKYNVFTDEFDEIIKAEELETDEELVRLRQNLDQQLLQLKSFISKLANKLQRKLLAKQNRSWDFDLEEGILDTSKLTRIIIDPFN